MLHTGHQIKRRAELDTSRASLHPGLGSNDYSMVDEAEETGGVPLTNDMIGFSRAVRAGPSSLAQRFQTVMQLLERHIEPLEHDLRANRTLLAGPSSLEQRFKTVMQLPKRPVEPLEHDLLRAEKERAEKAETEARQAAREIRQAKLEAEHWKDKFKKLMGTKVGDFLDAI